MIRIKFEESRIVGQILSNFSYTIQIDEISIIKSKLRQFYSHKSQGKVQNISTLTSNAIT